METHDTSAADAFSQLLQGDLKQAMRDRDRAATAAIRRLMSALSNAEAVAVPDNAPAQVVNPGSPVVPPRSDVARAELSGNDLARIVAAEVDDIASAIAQYDSHGRTEHAATLRREKEILERYRRPSE